MSATPEPVRRTLHPVAGLRDPMTMTLDGTVSSADRMVSIIGPSARRVGHSVEIWMDVDGETRTATVGADRPIEIRGDGLVEY